VCQEASELSSPEGYLTALGCSTGGYWACGKKIGSVMWTMREGMDTTLEETRTDEG